VKRKVTYPHGKPPEFSTMNIIQGQPDWWMRDEIGQDMGHAHLWNVMVLTECLKLGVKLMNAILVRLPCQLLHLIGKLRGAHEYKRRLDAKE
jgi:hypothetical protein